MPGETENETTENRRTLLRQLGAGAAGLSTIAVAESAEATGKEQSANRALRPSLELAIGDESWGNFEEADDYHDIDNSTFSGFDVQLTISGASNSTLLCGTGILKGSSHVKSVQTAVENADSVHTDYHRYTTGLIGKMDGRYTLFGVAADAVGGSVATDAVDFTVR
jgi:hypothetical protein